MTNQTNDTQTWKPVASIPEAKQPVLVHYDGSQYGFIRRKSNNQYYASGTNPNVGFFYELPEPPIVFVDIPTEDLYEQDIKGDDVND